MATSRIAVLAAIIATHTKQVDAHLAAKGLPSPSFDPESPAEALMDSEVTASRQSILDATDELHALMQGPVDIIAGHPVSISAMLCVRSAACIDMPRDSSTLGSAGKPSSDSDSLPPPHPARMKQLSPKWLRAVACPKPTFDACCDTQ